MHAHEAINDAITEAHAVGSVDFSEALKFIPDEHRASRPTLRESFVASVAWNAKRVNRSPYTVACYALDI